MDAATLQAKVYSGYAKAALRTGYTFDIFRPSVPMLAQPTPSFPLDQRNKVGSTPATFTVGTTGYNFEKAPAHKDSLWVALLDGTKTRPGDYLFNAAHGTYFVATMPDLVPILCVRCTSVIDIARVPLSAAVGIQPYSGTTAGEEVAVMKQWPASVSLAQRGRVSEVGLPLDLPSPFWLILLPSYPDLIIRTGDIIKDNLDQRYVVAAAELSPLGWRLSAQLAVT